MRHPRSWNDPDLLLDEPLCTLLFKRTCCPPTRNRNARGAVVWDDIPAVLKEKDDDIAAVQAWLHLAFPADEEKPAKRSRIAVNDETLNIFVEFYWQLYKKEDAPQYLNTQRIKLGFDYMVVLTKEQVASATSGTKLLSSVAKSKRKPRSRPRSTVEKHKKLNPKQPASVAERSVGDSGTADIPQTVAQEPNKTAATLGIQKGSGKVRAKRKARTRVIESSTTINSLTATEDAARLRNATVDPSPAVPMTSSSDRLQMRNIDLESRSNSHIAVQDTIEPKRQKVKSSSKKRKHTSKIPAGDPSHNPALHITTPNQSHSRPTLEDTATGFQEDKLIESAPKRRKTMELMSRVDYNWLRDPLTSTHLIAARDFKKETQFRSMSDNQSDDHNSSCVSGFVPTEYYSATSTSIRGIYSAVDGDIGIPLKIPEPSCHDATTTQRRPPLPAKPPIWAKSRQEVCESFDWFRSYQGGVYHSQNIVKGYLLSAFASSRDLFHHDGKLIISHGGGKSESLHSHKGQIHTQMADDQLAQDKSVRALLANYRDRRPLVLLVDDKYKLFPFDLTASGVTYAVLGFYTIVHAWAEYQSASNNRGRVVRYKFAFQWCDNQGEPWWSGSKDTNDFPHQLQIESSSALRQEKTSFQRHVPTKIGTLTSKDTKTLQPSDLYSACSECDAASPQVYTKAWMCLNPDCAAFWTIDRRYPDWHEFEFNEDFLRLVPALHLPAGLLDLRPPLPNNTPTDDITTTASFRKGWHCHCCGRLSCRFTWEHWECSECGNIHRVSGRIQAPPELRDPVNSADHAFAYQSSIVTVKSWRVDIHHGYVLCQTFKLPRGGYIHHLQARSTTSNDSDADTIFKAYQEQAAAGTLRFRRWPLRTHKLRGPLLTNYFSQNCGEPYQYVGGTENTVPFDTPATPSAVVKARELIQLRLRQTLGRDIHFNEVLSVAYMEKQSMAFHSDSERGLGPLVAGLSLGSPAYMHFRMIFTEEQGEESQKKKRSKKIATIVLRHGDVLVMDGKEVQDNYEHTVEPTNFRIAATARLINPNTI